MEMSWELLMEKHLEQMMEMNSVHPTEKPKELRSVCLLVEMMAMLKALLTEIGSVQLMETQWAQLMEMSWVQLMVKPKEMCLVYLSADLRGMQTVLMTETN
eukprot:scaffold21136_cov69-Skeletonema_dohrnii-CCMP3373.AAC.3